MGSNTNEAVYWVWLAEAIGQGSRESSILFDCVSGPQEVYENDNITVDSYVSERFGRLKPETVGRLNNKNLENAGNIIASCIRNKIKIITCRSAKYPARLRNIPDFPVILYYRGNPSLLSAPMTVGVVGTRSMTNYGKAATFDIVTKLSLYDVVTVSGAAIGVDSTAQSTSRHFGRQTIAVLGNGLDDPYPRDNRELIDMMCLENLVITEYPPCTRPEGKHFPVRNRIIAALSDALLVIEGNRKSGALITARLAEKFGKSVYAVPGSIYSESSTGTNELLRKGARICITGEEIIADFSERIELKKLESVENSARYQKFTEAPKGRPELASDNIRMIPDFVPKNGNNTKNTEPTGDRVEPPRQKTTDNDDRMIAAMWRDIDRTKAEAAEKSPPAQGSAPDEKPQESPSEPYVKKDPKFMTANDHLLEAMGSEPVNADTIAESCGMPVAKVLSILTMLELTGEVENLPGGLYRRTVKRS